MDAKTPKTSTRSTSTRNNLFGFFLAALLVSSAPLTLALTTDPETVEPDPDPLTFTFMTDPETVEPDPDPLHAASRVC